MLSVSAAYVEEERVGRGGEVGGERKRELASSITDLIEPYIKHLLCAQQLL